MTHGERGCYQSGCRCDLCSAANRAYMVRWREHLTGRVVSADQARAYLLRLRACGVGYRQAAKLAGIGASTAGRIASGERAQIRSETAAGILGIERPRLASKQPVSAGESYRTRERLRRLIEEQYPLPWLAQQLGSRYLVTLTWPSRRRQAPRVSVRTWGRIKALHQRLLWDDPSTPSGGACHTN